MHVLSNLFVPVILLYALSHAHWKIIVIIDQLLYIEKEEEAEEEGYAPTNFHICPNSLMIVTYKYLFTLW